MNDSTFHYKGKVEAISLNDKYFANNQVVYDIKSKKLYHVAKVHEDGTNCDAIIYNNIHIVCKSNINDFITLNIIDCYKIVIISKRIINNNAKLYVWNIHPTTINNMITIQTKIKTPFAGCTNDCI